MLRGATGEANGTTLAHSRFRSARKTSSADTVSPRSPSAIDSSSSDSAAASSSKVSSASRASTVTTAPSGNGSPSTTIFPDTTLPDVITITAILTRMRLGRISVRPTIGADPRRQPATNGASMLNAAGSSALLGRRLRLDTRHFTGPTEHRRDLHHVWPSSVHDSKLAGDDFTKLRRGALQDHPPRVWKHPKAFNRGHDSLHGQVRIELRVNRDVRANLFDIRDGLRRPNEIGHRPRRRLTSSCGMPSPRSSCVKPVSIFARKTSRSIASSTVASAGSSRMASTILSRVIRVVMLPRF